MTTRAGFTGVLTGFLSTMIVYIFFAAEPAAFLNSRGAGLTWLPAALSVLLTFTGGLIAARRSGSGQAWRCAALGALAGGLAGSMLFCLWGAAAAGAGWRVSPLETSADEVMSRIGMISAIAQQTMHAFLALFLGGSMAGALGGWLCGLRRPKHADTFDMAAPQMALNASITAVPASIMAAGLAAAIFPRLAESIGTPGSAAPDMPLNAALLLVLVSQAVLTMVIPHEARQAAHRCGTDEVKMGAFVGIGAAPALFLLLLSTDAECLLNLPVPAALTASAVMSLISIRTLVKCVLPKRASFAVPQDEAKRAEAKWFGSIAKSYGARLVKLCTGCGIVMVLPVYVCVISVLINLSGIKANSAVLPSAGIVPWKLFLTQAGTSLGIITAVIVLLSLIYLFYLNLGRRFSKRNASRSNG